MIESGGRDGTARDPSKKTLPPSTFSPFCKASLQTSRPSSASAWAPVRMVPKRTLLAQRHLWRPLPSVPLFARCSVWLPFQWLSKMGNMEQSKRTTSSACIPWRSPRIDSTATAARGPAKSGQVPSPSWSHGRQPPQPELEQKHADVDLTAPKRKYHHKTFDFTAAAFSCQTHWCPAEPPAR